MAGLERISQPLKDLTTKAQAPEQVIKLLPNKSNIRPERLRTHGTTIWSSSYRAEILATKSAESVEKLYTLDMAPIRLPLKQLN
jgi:hypothetical protein